MRFTISVGFDGVVAMLDKFPSIGRMMPRVDEFLAWCVARGICLILDTCREDESLSMALEWLEARDLLRYFSYINENSEEKIRYHGYDCRKIDADMYLGVEYVGLPVRYARSCKRVYQYVRFDRVKMYICESEREFYGAHG